jgi:nicotinamidase-related amidase
MKNNSKCKKNNRKTNRKTNRKSKRGGAKELQGYYSGDTKDFINRYMFNYNKQANLEVFDSSYEIEKVIDSSYEIEKDVIKIPTKQTGIPNILYVIDMQNDFIDRNVEVDSGVEGLKGPPLDKGKNIGAFAVNNGSKLINELIAFLNLNKDRFDKIIFTRDFHDENHCSFYTRENGPFPPHCVIGTVGSGLVKEIKDWINDSNSIIKDKIEILFKGMHPEQDSFGAVEYADKHISKRQVGNCKKTKQSNVNNVNNVNSSCSIFTGCKKIRFPKTYNPTDDFVFKNESKENICKYFEPYNIFQLTGNNIANIYVCGLAGDFCVRDTALNFSDNNPEKPYAKRFNVNVIHDLTRNAFIPISIPQPSYPFNKDERYGGELGECKYLNGTKLSEEVTNEIENKELYYYVFKVDENGTSILPKEKLVELNEKLDFELVEGIPTNSEYHHFLTDHKQILHDYKNAGVKLITKELSKIEGGNKKSKKINKKSSKKNKKSSKNNKN